MLCLQDGEVVSHRDGEVVSHLLIGSGQNEWAIKYKLKKINGVCFS